VAEAAGVEGTASETIERVADNLAKRPVLLVLDNCEHVPSDRLSSSSG
jgi:predicted ATPase